MSVIDIDQLEKIRAQNMDKKIVFCSGSFDLVHAGHILFFEDCKKHGDILVVSVGTDSIVKSNKGGKRPILNEHIRLKTVDSLKPVDYCLLDTISDKSNPLLLLDVVLGKLRPEVYVINEDAFDIPYRQSISKALDVELLVLPRTCPEEFENLSTSQIIEKIKDLD